MNPDTLKKERSFQPNDQNEIGSTLQVRIIPTKGLLWLINRLLNGSYSEIGPETQTNIKGENKKGRKLKETLTN